MNNIRDFLGFSGIYSNINREERHLAAIFYSLLLNTDNLKSFLDLIDCNYTIKDDEFGIYYEYAFIRDLWNIIGDNNDKKRDLIYTILQPQNVDELRAKSVEDFNRFFGTPNQSKVTIESPSNWSILHYMKSFSDDDQGTSEFLKVCRFKWAFNIKPDIVIHTSKNQAICIECKLHSDEGKYPGNHKEEKDEFHRRNLSLVEQTDIQRYALSDLLGLETKYVMILKKEKELNNNYLQLTWRQVFDSLNKENIPVFIQERISHL